MSSSWGKDEHGPGGDPSWLGGDDRGTDGERDAPEASRAPEPGRRASADFAGSDLPSGEDRTRWSPSFGEDAAAHPARQPERRSGVEGFASRIDGPRLLKALGSFAIAVVFLLFFTQGFGGAGGFGSSFGAFPWMFLLIAGIPVVKALLGRGKD